MMTEEGYLKDRLDDQINWYSTTSKKCQIKYKVIKGAEIVCAASIPFLANSTIDQSNSIVGVLGVLIVVGTGIISMNKYHENWIEFRSTCESLKHQKYLFETKAEPYNSTSDSFRLLVQNVESLISKENSKWMSNFTKKEGEKDD